MDSMCAAFQPVSCECGGTTDTYEGNVRFRQFDGAAVSLPRHGLGGLCRCDLLRLSTEEVRKRPIGIGNKYLQYRA